MPNSEKFFLKWNDFEGNVRAAFSDLREDQDFSNVTLVCDDGYQMEAHKVILAATCPFFKNLLRRNKHPHPLIYMRGIKSDNLTALLDFLYYGEANIYQENLDNFLGIAKELQLQGLDGEEERDGSDVKDITISNISDSTSPKETSQIHTRNAIQTNISVSGTADDEMAIFLPKQEFCGDMKELDDRIETMVGRGENMIKVSEKRAPTKSYLCKVCGKEGQRINVRDHIEAHHLEGISVPCKFCQKTFRSRIALRKHTTIQHTNQHTNRN